MDAAEWIVGKSAKREKVAPRTVEIVFFAEDTKAICVYRGPNTSQKGIEVEVKDRSHALALVKKAVQRANEFETSIKMLHGSEIDGYAKDCLSDKVAMICRAIVEKAEHTADRGLWKASW